MVVSQVEKEKGGVRPHSGDNIQGEENPAAFGKVVQQCCCSKNVSKVVARGGTEVVGKN